jgi:hypothetical protein
LKYHEPVITTELATLCTEIMAAIPFFPSETGARSAIANEVQAMCWDEDQALWLVTRMVRLYPRWPSIFEMRLVYCSKYQPLDGENAIGGSEFYPDGIPSENPESEPRKLIAGAGEPFTADVEFAETLIELATKTRLDSAMPPVRAATDDEIAMVIEQQRKNKAAKNAVMTDLA